MITNLNIYKIPLTDYDKSNYYHFYLWGKWNTERDKFLGKFIFNFKIKRSSENENIFKGLY
jgi:hypothetical protein